MEDIDGKFTYSPVRRMDCNSSQKIIIGPNPTVGHVAITVTLAKSTVLSITVVDAIGNRISKTAWQANAGQNTQQIDLTNMPSAVYLISIEGENINETRRIIKR
jgi:hypothetical protein